MDQSELKTSTVLTPPDQASTARNPKIPKKGERALILGMTGSGKTSFAIRLLELIPDSPQVIYDTKYEPKFDKLPNSIRVPYDETLSALHEAVDNPEYDYVILDIPPEVVVDKRTLDHILWMHYQHLHGVVAYVDEVAEFHTASGRAGIGLMALLQRGRSKGITFIASTQRPTWITRSLLSEAQRGYVFRLKLEDDRARVADMIPDYDDYENPKPHWFWYYRDGDDKATLQRPIKLDPKYDTGYTDDDQAQSGDAAGEAPALARHIWV